MFRYLALLVSIIALSDGFVIQLTDEKVQSDTPATEQSPGLREPPIEALTNTEKGKRFEIKKRADDGALDDTKIRRDTTKHTIHVINQALEELRQTFGRPEFRSSKTMSFVDKILDTLKRFVNGPEFRTSKAMRYMEKIIEIVKEAAHGPGYRSGGAPNMKTEMKHFQNGQPSLVFEMKPSFFLEFIKKVLSNQLVERYLDDLSGAPRRPKKVRYP